MAETSDLSKSGGLVTWSASLFFQVFAFGKYDELGNFNGNMLEGVQVLSNQNSRDYDILSNVLFCLAPRRAWLERRVKNLTDFNDLPFRKKIRFTSFIRRSRSKNKGILIAEFPPGFIKSLRIYKKYTYTPEGGGKIRARAYFFELSSGLVIKCFSPSLPALRATTTLKLLMKAEGMKISEFKKTQAFFNPPRIKIKTLHWHASAYMLFALLYRFLFFTLLAIVFLISVWYAFNYADDDWEKLRQYLSVLSGSNSARFI